MTCEKCGKTLEVGQWPYCPHGLAQSSIQTNESFIGGVTLENMGDAPVTVYSREELRRECEKRGLEQRIKHVAGDKFLTNWAAGIDAYTLAAATALLERGRVPAIDETALPSYRGEVRLLNNGNVVDRKTL